MLISRGIKFMDTSVNKVLENKIKFTMENILSISTDQRANSNESPNLLQVKVHCTQPLPFP